MTQLIDSLLFTLARAENPVLPAGSTVAAPTATGGATPPPSGSLTSTLLMFGLMFVVFYFFMIRPQQKKLKEHQGLLSALKHGDDVVTASGLFGTIAGLTDKVVTLEVSNNVKIKVLKSQIAQVLKGDVKELT